MTSMDKAGMAMAIAITAIFLGIVASMGAVQDTPAYTAPAVTKEMPESKTQTESFGADIAEKVKSEDIMMEKETVELEEEIIMEETVEEEIIMEETVEEEIIMEETVEEEIIMEETVEEEIIMEETVEEEIIMEETVEEEIIMEETVEEEIIMEETVEEETHEEPAGPTTHTVDIPTGTSVPGCEESNACYSPADITINAGDTVEWINVDTAAHTVTGGSPADGPSYVFDSSLVIANANYAFTFDDAGSYDYFCMVHPWMVGSVTVN